MVTSLIVSSSFRVTPKRGRPKYFTKSVRFSICLGSKLACSRINASVSVQKGSGKTTAADNEFNHDIQFLEELVENFAGFVPADKGFIDAIRQALLQERQGVAVITPARKNMVETQPLPLRRLCSRWRKRIETVGSQLTERFAIDHIRVRNIWHFQHRIIRKVLAHTIGVFLNLQLGRNPLDLDGLFA